MTLYGKCKNRILAVLSMLVLAISLISQNAYASEKVSLTIEFQSEGSPVKNAVFHLYKIGEISENGDISLMETFKSYSITVDKTDSGSWKAAAETLAAYIERDQIQPLDTGITNDQGIIKFPGRSVTMTEGLYLVIGETCKTGNETYHMEPTLVRLPKKNDAGVWENHVTIYPKQGVEEEITEVKVLKIWKDTGNKELRPDRIEVQLLQDGQIYDTVILNKDNNWRYEWGSLEIGHVWKIVEKTVPDGYTVAIERDKTIFSLINTYEDDIPETPGESETSSEPELPQTGMLMWPIPILAGSGMILFLIGWIRHRKNGDEHDVG